MDWEQHATAMGDAASEVDVRVERGNLATVDSVQPLRREREVPDLVAHPQMLRHIVP